VTGFVRNREAAPAMSQKKELGATGDLTDYPQRLREQRKRKSTRRTGLQRNEHKAAFLHNLKMSTVSCYSIIN
jgi:hypothetical protein